MAKHYDVIIVGGGMVGSALGCALGQIGLHVAVLEARAPRLPAANDPYDLRVSSLNLASENILKRVGVWDELLASQRIAPWRRIRVWEEAGRGETEFSSLQVGEPIFGHFAENQLIQHALVQRLASLPEVDWFCPVTIRTMTVEPIHATVETDQHTLTADLLIGADGANSAVRRAAAIGTHSWDYEQGVVLSSVVTTLPQQDVSWQHFTPNGPQAFLPLPGPHACLVWYHQPREIQRLLALPDDAFQEELNRAFPEDLGGVEKVHARGSFPLRHQHALRYVDDRVALVGDAAHTVHPLAGQGVNLGFLDVAMLVGVLQDIRDQGRDLGDGEMLRAYETRRRRENLAMMAAIEGFYRLFGNDIPPLKWLRNTGMGVANRLGPAKQQVMRFALGLAGQVPELARPVAD